MSTPTSGSPHDPLDGHDAAPAPGAGSQPSTPRSESAPPSPEHGSQHSAPVFGGGASPQDRGGSSGSSAAPSPEAPSFGGSAAGAGGPGTDGPGGAPSAGGADQPGQQPRSSGMPQYRPAGGGANQNPYAAGGPQYGGGYQQGGTARKSRGRPPLWVGLVSLGLGLLLGLIAIIVFVTTILGAVGDVADTPSGSQQVLEEDTEYYVFSTGTDSVDACRVYTPSFESLDLDVSGSMDQTVTSNDQTFHQLGTFTSQEAGEYTVTCTPYVAGDEMYISDAGVGGALGGGLASVGLGMLGGLLIVLGIVLIIVNRVTASRSRG